VRMVLTRCSGSSGIFNAKLVIFTIISSVLLQYHQSGEVETLLESIMCSY